MKPGSLIFIRPGNYPFQGVTSAIILNQMQNAKKKAHEPGKRYCNSLKSKNPEVFLTMGAGDIDLLVDTY